MKDVDGGEAAARRRSLHAALETVCVTGTNGKTSTTRMLSSIFRAAGEPSAEVTTLGARVDGRELPYDASMEGFLDVAAAAVAAGARHFAVETTSRALSGGFADRWPARVAVFTNLSRDHLDRHGTPEAYLLAKTRLFLALPSGGTAVLNAADPAHALVAQALPANVALASFAAGAPVIDGFEPALAVREVQATRGGASIAWAPSAFGDALGDVTLSAAGAFQVDNAAAAAVAARALGFEPRAIRAGLTEFPGVPGRFERIARQPLVLVDFAHTPDALTRTLEAARALVSPDGGRVLCVFGCGGDRDAGKRAPMGAVADTLCDHVVLTTDNPRGEDPRAIARAVRSGAAGRASWTEEADRERAIHRALEAALPADALVIAGRGHESVQVFAEGPRPLSDADAARRACDDLGIPTDGC